ncbi:MAG: hypothetical protein IPK53_19400 [bacterium]|nr:hypothetical protein [bacterium]
MADLLHQLANEEMTQLVTADPEWIYLFQHALTRKWPESLLVCPAATAAPGHG